MKKVKIFCGIILLYGLLFLMPVVFPMIFSEMVYARQYKGILFEKDNLEVEKKYKEISGTFEICEGDTDVKFELWEPDGTFDFYVYKEDGSLYLKKSKSYETVSFDDGGVGFKKTFTESGKYTFKILTGQDQVPFFFSLFRIYGIYRDDKEFTCSELNLDREEIVLEDIGFDGGDVLHILPTPFYTSSEIKIIVKDENIVNAIAQKHGNDVLLIGLEEGTTNVIVKCGKYKKMCTVTVKKKKHPCTKLVLSKKKMNVYVNEEIGQSWTFWPANCTDEIKFTVSNKQIATVSEDGAIIGKKPGTVTVTARMGKKTSTCKVTVKKSPMIGKPYVVKKEKNSYYACDYGFGFAKDSLNGIKLAWEAKNLTGKVINYYTIHLEMINNVGDVEADEISGDTTIIKRNVGPIKPNEYLYFYDYVGYNKFCKKVKITQIDLVYSDKSKQTIKYNRVAEEYAFFSE